MGGEQTLTCGWDEHTYAGQPLTYIEIGSASSAKTNRDTLNNRRIKLAMSTILTVGDSISGAASDSARSHPKPGEVPTSGSALTG